MSLEDSAVLARSAAKGRILLTHDRKTMPRHFRDYLRSSSSPGVIIVAQDLDIGAAIEDLLIVWAASDADEWMNEIGFLPL